MENKDYWIWLDDGEDHLESLVCPVLIEAYQLRALIEKAKRKEWERVMTHITDNFQYYIEGTNDGFIFHKDRWDALKSGKGEGE